MLGMFDTLSFCFVPRADVQRFTYPLLFFVLGFHHHKFGDG